MPPKRAASGATARSQKDLEKIEQRREGVRRIRADIRTNSQRVQRMLTQNETSIANELTISDREALRQQRELNAALKQHDAFSKKINAALNQLKTPQPAAALQPAAASRNAFEDDDDEDEDDEIIRPRKARAVGDSLADTRRQLSELGELIVESRKKLYDDLIRVEQQHQVRLSQRQNDLKTLNQLTEAVYVFQDQTLRNLDQMFSASWVVESVTPWMAEGYGNIVSRAGMALPVPRLEREIGDRAIEAMNAPSDDPEAIQAELTKREQRGRVTMSTGFYTSASSQHMYTLLQQKQQLDAMNVCNTPAPPLVNADGSCSRGGVN